MRKRRAGTCAAFRSGGGGGASPVPARRGGRGCARSWRTRTGGAMSTAIRDHT